MMIGQILHHYSVQTTQPCYCIVANSLSGSTPMRGNATYVVSYLGILYNSGFCFYDVTKNFQFYIQYGR